MYLILATVSLLTTLSGKKQKTYINKNARQVKKSFFRSLLHSWNITIEFYVIFVPFQAGNKKKKCEQFAVELKNKYVVYFGPFNSYTKKMHRTTNPGNS